MLSKSRGVYLLLLLVGLLVLVLVLVSPGCVNADSPSLYPGDTVKARGVSFINPACNLETVGTGFCKGVVMGSYRTKVTGKITTNLTYKGREQYLQYGKYRVTDEDGTTSWYPKENVTLIRRAPRLPLTLKR